MVAPFAAMADSFKVEAVDLEPGTTGTLKFTLDNSQDCYGFQADVTLPEGLEAVTGTDGQYISLSDRASAEAAYVVESNKKGTGLIIGTYSTAHKPFTGNSGVIATMQVNVTDKFNGGDVSVSNIYLIDVNDKDVTLDPATTAIGVLPSAISFSRTSLILKVEETTTLEPKITPSNAESKTTISWSSSAPAVATVSEKGLVTAVSEGEAVITATTSNGKTASIKATVSTNVIAVTEITISKTTLELTEGDTDKLSATISPANASDPSVSWHSSNESIVTVDENGNIKAVKAGSATITAEASNGKTATCTVTVKGIPVDGITLSQSALTLTEGENATLTATVTPANASDKTVTWSSNDTAVATVDATGKVTAVAPGTATITAKAGEKTATCTVTVKAKIIEVTGITLDKTTATLTVGDNLTLTATVAPANATDKTVTWTSSDAAVATVDATGKVTAVKAGTATITANAGEKTATCTVTVNAKTIAVTGITLSRTEVTLVEGKSLTLTATVTPTDATDKTVAWTSSNPAAATVDTNGKVTAVAAGKTTITAKAGDKSATCDVTVEADLTGSSNSTVKMTYVDFSNPDKAYGEIAAGQTAESGYNKISNGTVGFGNTGWGVNFITYLQVNVSDIKGFILGATLTFEASGSTDSKRTTVWGAGYNNTPWSADMTYNSADKKITLVGATAETTSKSKDTFNSLSIDITKAVKNADENGLVTIILYETNAGGGFVKNPAVTVNWTTEPTYNVTFTETNGAKDVTVLVDDSDATDGISLLNGTYGFTASAPHYKDYTGDFTVNGADLNVEFAMTPKAVWNYTVNAVDAEGKLLNKLSEGEGYEEENTTFYFPGYYLQGTTLLSKQHYTTNPYYGETVKLESDGMTFEVKYDGTAISDVVFYKEAENIEGFTSRSSNNAPIRCSNGLGGTAEGDVLLTTLPAGKYKIHGQVWGTTGLTAGVKTKDGKELWTLASTGSLVNSDSEEFMLSADTELYVYTTDGDLNRMDQHMLDLVYIQKTGEFVNVSGITLSKEAVEIVKGADLQLTATVAPENASDKALTWTSSNEKVATVDQNGKVTAVEGGEAVITVASVSNPEVKAECKVTVTVPVAGLTLLDEDENPLADGAEIEIHTGHEYNLTAVVDPENATDKTVTWTTSDETVIGFLDDEGLIDGLKAGEATVTASIAGYSVSVKVKVTDPLVPVTGVKLDRTTAEMKTGDTLQLNATVEPEDATSKDVTWTSSDKTIATVSTKGLVKALKAGKVTITVSANKKTATCEITITDYAVEGITLSADAITLTEGEDMTLTATVAPENATDKTVTWSSSDETVATVDQNGKVTAVKAGEAVITAKAGEKSAACKVTVEAAAIEVEEITIDLTDEIIKVGETLILTATVTPADATDVTVTWSSSDESIATVDDKGVVTGVSMGQVTITATAGGKTAESKVTVQKSTAVELGFDAEAPLKVYDLNGLYISDKVDGLQQGNYIIRQGDTVKKVRIR